MTKPLNEQVIVLAGASSGMGRETAKRLAAKGARVVVSSRNEESLADLVDEIKSEGGEAAHIPADVSDYKDVAALAKGTEQLYGQNDHLLVERFGHYFSPLLGARGWGLESF